MVHPNYLKSLSHLGLSIPVLLIGYFTNCKLASACFVLSFWLGREIAQI